MPFGMQSSRFRAQSSLRKQGLIPKRTDPLDPRELQMLEPESAIEFLVGTDTGSLFGKMDSDYAIFKKGTRRVSLTEDGAYIPRSLFPPHQDIDYRITRSPDGVVSVNVFSVGTADLVRTASDRSREIRWIAEHRNQYANQWVALDGDRLLSHGDNAREVYTRAREFGVNLPFVARVEPEGSLPFGGW